MAILFKLRIPITDISIEQSNVSFHVITLFSNEPLSQTIIEQFETNSLWPTCRLYR
jgi:hypothetical protein